MEITADDVAEVRNVVDVRKSTSDEDVAFSGNGKDVAFLAIVEIRHWFTQSLSSETRARRKVLDRVLDGNSDVRQHN